MKIDIIKNLTIGLTVATGASSMTSCSRDFLNPDPLSVYEPSKTFTTEESLQAALAMADRHLCNNYTYYESKNLSVPIATEYMMSDLMLYGKTDNTGGFWDDINKKLTPSSGMQENDNNYMAFYWSQGYTGIKYANTVLLYIDGMSNLSQEKKNEYKGRALFHRAYRYYNLCWQFGDIPLVTKILEAPKLNYKSTKRQAILEMCVKDMEEAVKLVPSQKEMSAIGMVNKEACRMLLAKLYLSVGKWKEAENQCNELIDHSGLALMKQPFGDGTLSTTAAPETWNITRNVIWDLHVPQNKYRTDNTETILAMLNVSDQRHIDYLTMRIFGPNWSGNYTQSPDGKIAGARTARDDQDYNSSLDNIRGFGRGIGIFRPSAWAQHSLWKVNGVEDQTDYRHNSTIGNWVHMEDIKYNNKESEYYNQNYRLYDDNGQCLCNDTISGWFDFPLYKIYIKDMAQENNTGSTDYQGCSKGSDGSLYLYRLAEAYLVRAEAKFYQGDASGAANDVNEIRRRAHCSQYYTTVNIGDIMNERARELYLEEWRNVELTRVSYDLALSGKPDEWGNTYNVNTWDKQEGTELTGGSYWYQRCVHYSFYNQPYGQNIKSGQSTNICYTMNKNNVFWPIPESAITANRSGKLAQNYGYAGYDASTPEWESWEEAVADEYKSE